MLPLLRERTGADPAAPRVIGRRGASTNLHSPDINALIQAAKDWNFKQLLRELDGGPPVVMQMEKGPGTSPSMTDRTVRYRDVDARSVSPATPTKTPKRSFISQDLDVGLDTDALEPEVSETDDNAIQRQIQQDEQAELSRSQETTFTPVVNGALSLLNSVQKYLSPSKPPATPTIPVSSVSLAPPVAPVAFMGAIPSKVKALQKESNPSESRTTQDNNKRPTPSDEDDSDDDDERLSHSAKRQRTIGSGATLAAENGEALLTPMISSRPPLPPAAHFEAIPQSTRPSSTIGNAIPQVGTLANPLKTPILRKTPGAGQSASSRVRSTPSTRGPRPRKAKDAVGPDQYKERPGQQGRTESTNTHPLPSPGIQSRFPATSAGKPVSGTQRPGGRRPRHVSPIIEVSIVPHRSPSHKKTGRPAATDSDSTDENFSDSDASEDSEMARFVASASRQSRGAASASRQTRRSTQANAPVSSRHEGEATQNARSRGKTTRKSTRLASKDAMQSQDLLLDLYDMAHAWSRKYQKVKIETELCKTAWKDMTRLRTSIKPRASTQSMKENLSSVLSSVDNIIARGLFDGKKTPIRNELSKTFGTYKALNQRRCKILEEVHKVLLPSVVLIIDALEDLPNMAKDLDLVEIAVELTSVAERLSSPKLYEHEPMSETVAEILGNEEKKLGECLEDAAKHFEEMKEKLEAEKEDEQTRLFADQQRKKELALKQRFEEEARQRARVINQQIYEQITLRKYKLEESYRKQFEAYRASHRRSSATMGQFDPPRLQIDLDADNYDDDRADIISNEDAELADGPVDGEQVSEMEFDSDSAYFQLPGEDFERLEMPGFGNRGQARKKSAGPWREDELQALCQGLEKHQGNDRYPKILDEWGKPGGPLADRDMDEIFEQAKEIKALLVKVEATDGTPVEDWLMSV